jgi:hypothetical protein
MFKKIITKKQGGFGISTLVIALALLIGALALFTNTEGSSELSQKTTSDVNATILLAQSGKWQEIASELEYQERADRFENQSYIRKYGFKIGPNGQTLALINGTSTYYSSHSVITGPIAPNGTPVNWQIVTALNAGDSNFAITSSISIQTCNKLNLINASTAVVSPGLPPDLSASQLTAYMNAYRTDVRCLSIADSTLRLIVKLNRI